MAQFIERTTSDSKALSNVLTSTLLKTKVRVWYLFSSLSMHKQSLLKLFSSQEKTAPYKMYSLSLFHGLWALFTGWQCGLIVHVGWSTIQIIWCSQKPFNYPGFKFSMLRQEQFESHRQYLVTSKSKFLHSSMEAIAFKSVRCRCQIYFTFWLCSYMMEKVQAMTSWQIGKKVGRSTFDSLRLFIMGRALQCGACWSGRVGEDIRTAHSELKKSSRNKKKPPSRAKWG